MTISIVDLPTRVPRDGRDKPLVIPKGGGKPVALIRTTTFIDVLEDKSNLIDWRARSVLAGVAAKPGIAEAARGLDVKADRVTLNGLTEAAVEASGANSKREYGTYLHGLSELVDRGEPLPEGTTERDIQAMAAYLTGTSNLTHGWREHFTVCASLGTGGTPDAISWYDGPGPDGKPFAAWIIVDLKTGSVEYGGLKMPTQLAVYSRSETYDPSVYPAPDRTQDERAWQAWRRRVFTPEEAAACYAPIADINQDWGLVVHLDAETGKCDRYWADLNLGWEAAQEALRVRALRKRKGLIPWVPREASDGVDTAAASV